MEHLIPDSENPLDGDNYTHHTVIPDVFVQNIFKIHPAENDYWITARMGKYTITLPAAKDMIWIVDGKPTIWNVDAVQGAFREYYEHMEEWHKENDAKRAILI